MGQSNTFPTSRYRRQPSGMTNHYLTKGDTTSILIARRNGDIYEMLIDTDDLPRVLALPGKIGVRISGGKYKSVYAWITIDGQNLPFARWLIGCPDDREPDHIDHHTLNNKRNNLRIATRAQNNANRRMGAWKIRRGVWPHRHLPRWGAFVWLGEFDDEADANRIYDEALAAMKREGIIDVELAPPGLPQSKADAGTSARDQNVEDAAA